MIDGEAVSGVFAADLTLAEVRQLRAKQRWEFRDHSFDGRFGLVTFEEFIDVALAAGRAVGIYPGELSRRRRRGEERESVCEHCGWGIEGWR